MTVLSRPAPTLLRVRDRSGYEVIRSGCRNADVTATSGSRSSSAVTARSGWLNNNVEPGLSDLDRKELSHSGNKGLDKYENSIKTKLAERTPPTQ